MPSVMPGPILSQRILWLALALAAPVTALAQTDEIQVYDGELTHPGGINLMVHDNFTFKGSKEPAFPGGVISNHALVGTAEWAFGITRWFEQGLYLPLYSHSENLGGTYNGFKVRELFARPHAEEHTFVYGVNFEFSVNQKSWDARRYTSEIRPIIGWHLKPPDGAKWKPVDIFINPILDTDYTRGLKNLDFAPSVRVAYNLSEKWAVAAEEYADYGPLRQIYSVSEQSHQIWAVVNRGSKKWVDIEAGIGFGLTSSSDRVTVKFMVSRDLR